MEKPVGCCEPSGGRRTDRRRRAVDETSLDRTAALLKALADPTRLRIVARLSAEAAPLCVCEIEQQFDLSQPTISHHLKVLRSAGVVRTERRGLWVYYSIVPERLAALRDALAALSPEPQLIAAGA